jgi:hypothetical protein
MPKIAKMNAKERRKEQRALVAAASRAKRKSDVPRFISNLKGDAMTVEALDECLWNGLENSFVAQVMHISATGNAFARFGNEEAHVTERGMLRSSAALSCGDYVVVQVDRSARNLKLVADWDLTAELYPKAVLSTNPDKKSKKRSPLPSNEKLNLFALLESEDESEDEEDLAEREADERARMEDEEQSTRLSAVVVQALGAATAAASVAEAAVQYATETSAACAKAAAARKAVVVTKPTLVRLPSQKRQLLANLGKERTGWGDSDSECDSPFVDNWELMASPIGTPM